MGDLFGLSGVAQAAGNAAAASLNYQAQMDYNEKYLTGIRETNEANRLAAERQNQWNIDQWKREIEYNDPSAQANRMKLAGLSDAAAAQAVSNVPAPSMQSADLSVNQAPQPMAAPQLDVSGLNLIGLFRQLEGLKQDKINTDMKQNELDFQPSQLFTNQQLNDLTASQLRQQIQFDASANPYRLRGYQYDELMKNDTHRLNVLQRRIMYQNLRRARKELSWLDKLNTANLTKIFTEIGKIEVDKKKVEADTNLSYQEYVRNKTKAAFDKYGGLPNDALSRIVTCILEGVITPQSIQKNIENFSAIGNYVRKGVSSFLSNNQSNLLSQIIGGINETDSVLNQLMKDYQSELDSFNSRGIGYLRDKAKRKAK